jgi:hypothetical protein
VSPRASPSRVGSEQDSFESGGAAPPLVLEPGKPYSSNVRPLIFR